MDTDEGPTPVPAGSGRRAREERSAVGPPDRRVVLALGNALVFSVAGGPTAAYTVRSELRERLGPRLDPEVLELAELLVSELVNNCVLHGAAAGPEVWIDVTASLFPRCLWIEVSDGGPAFKHQPRAPSGDADSGRGLYLVEQVARRWGISARGTARVWFELPRAG
jgi:anti-sigma regulatory factor (Ser/Thr protein kinase)